MKPLTDLPRRAEQGGAVMTAPVVRKLRAAGYAVTFPDSDFPTWCPDMPAVRRLLMTEALASPDLPTLSASGWPVTPPPLGVVGPAAAPSSRVAGAAAT